MQEYYIYKPSLRNFHFGTSFWYIYLGVWVDMLSEMQKIEYYLLVVSTLYMTADQLAVSKLQYLIGTGKLII